MSSRDLADIIETLHRDRQTGVLSVSVRSDNNQLKFFFRSGTVYFVTYSTCRNLECLIRLGSLVADRGFFLPGAKVETPHPITLSMPDIIEQVRALKKTIEWSAADVSPRAGGPDAPDTATCRKIPLARCRTRPSAAPARSAPHRSPPERPRRGR